MVQVGLGNTEVKGELPFGEKAVIEEEPESLDEVLAELFEGQSIFLSGIR